MPNLVRISQNVVVIVETLSFIVFQNGGLPPSWICCKRAVYHIQRVIFSFAIDVLRLIWWNRCSTVCVLQNV